MTIFSEAQAILDSVKFSKDQIDTLKKRYTNINVKPHSDHYNELRNMLDRKEITKEQLIQLSKSNIPVVSDLAKNRIVLKYGIRVEGYDDVRGSTTLDELDQKTMKEIYSTILESDVFSKTQIDDLRKQYSKIKTINPDSVSYKTLIDMLDNKVTKKQLIQLSKENIPFVSALAKNRVWRKYDIRVEEYDDVSGSTTLDELDQKTLPDRRKEMDPVIVAKREKGLALAKKKLYGEDKVHQTYGWNTRKAKDDSGFDWEVYGVTPGSPSEILDKGNEKTRAVAINKAKKGVMKYRIRENGGDIVQNYEVSTKIFEISSFNSVKEVERNKDVIRTTVNARLAVSVGDVSDADVSRYKKIADDINVNFKIKDGKGYFTMKTFDLTKALTAKKVTSLSSLKEDIEVLDELSPGAKTTYKDAATKQIKELTPWVKKGEYKDIAKRMIDRRKKGLDRHAQMNEDDLDEKQSKDIVSGLNNMVHDDKSLEKNFSGIMDQIKWQKPKMLIRKAVDGKTYHITKTSSGKYVSKLVVEAVEDIVSTDPEQLDEISRNTLGSYLKQASIQKGVHKFKSTVGTPSEKDYHVKKAAGRGVGVGNAITKMMRKSLKNEE